MVTAPAQCVYVSGYTDKEGCGIYQYRFDGSTGQLTRVGLAAEAVQPSYIVQHGPCLYSTNEVGDYTGDDTTGFVTCYRRLDDGSLTFVGKQASGGKDPCHAIVDRNGHILLVANYSSGTVAYQRLTDFDNPSTSQSPRQNVAGHAFSATHKVPDRQEAAHAHSIDLDPVAQAYALSMDLGCDRAIIYRFDPMETDRSLVFHDSLEFPKGSGPRHLVFHPQRPNFCYVAGELSNELFTLSWDATRGKLGHVQHVAALPPDGSFKGSNLASEIDVTPDGRFLYVSMRGHDSLAIFDIDDSSGTLTLVGHHSTLGEHPRHFTIDPSGRFLLVGNQMTNTIVVFKIDKDTGLLTHVQTVDHPQPACIRFWA